MTPGPKAYYFFGSRMAATGTLPHHPSCRPSSLAFFCSRCGDLWAKVLVEGAETAWVFQVVPCEKHTPLNAMDWAAIPGSLSQAGFSDVYGAPRWACAFDYLPLSLQNRELLMLINHLERNNATQ